MLLATVHSGEIRWTVLEPRKDANLSGVFLLDLLSTCEMIYSIRRRVKLIEYIFSGNAEMAKKKQSTVGGARPGAGRKVAHPEGATIPLVASVPAVLVERLMAVASTKEWNRSEAVTEAVRLLLKKHEPKSTHD